MEKRSTPLFDRHALEQDYIRSHLLAKGRKLTRGRFLKALLRRTGRLYLLLRVALGGNPIGAAAARHLLRSRFTIELGRLVKIGPGIQMPHPMNIIIGGHAVLGENVTVGQHATIGGNQKKEAEIGGVTRRYPVVGNNVWIAAGAVVAGPIRIGDHVVVGANVAVTRDVASHRLLYHAPRISRKTIRVLPEGTYEEVGET